MKFRTLKVLNLSLKKKLVDYEEEILSLKIHNSRASIVLHDSTVHRTGEKNDVVESDPIVSKKTKSQPIGWLVVCPAGYLSANRRLDVECFCCFFLLF